jgi:hypothetical protein
VQIIAPIHAHRALLLAIAAERDAGEHPDFFKRTVMLVAV